jgi:hypothetical protein
LYDSIITWFAALKKSETITRGPVI